MVNLEKLPPDEIVVRKGRVVKLTQWCNWDGKSYITLKAQKVSGDVYTVFLRDHGNGITKLERGKTVEEAAKKVIHPKIAEKLGELFGLRNPTKKEIGSLRLRQREDGLKIIFQ